jgi:hypothetical protein
MLYQYSYIMHIILVEYKMAKEFMEPAVHIHIFQHELRNCLCKGSKRYLDIGVCKEQ